MSTIRVALANIRPGATGDESVALAVEAVAQASREKADVICFPECYVPGYRTPRRVMPPPDAAFLEQAWSTIAHAAQSARVAVVLGTERIVDGTTRITALVIDRD